MSWATVEREAGLQCKPWYQGISFLSRGSLSHANLTDDPTSVTFPCYAGMIFVVSIFCWYLRVSVFWRWLCAREIWIMPTPCNDIFISHLSPQSPHLTFRNSSETIFHLAVLFSLQRCNDCWHWLIVIFAIFSVFAGPQGGDKVQGCHSSR